MTKQKAEDAAPVLPEGKTVRKTIRHDFTPEERERMHGDLLGALGSREATEAEFDQVKSSFKARITEAESRITTIATALRTGFDFRAVECREVLRPKDRRKDYLREDTGVLVLTEDMSSDDFQRDLIATEAKFERREEIPLFLAVGSDFGTLAIGRVDGRWYVALRISIGAKELEERLTLEGRSFKKRPDAVRLTGKRALAWISENVGKEEAAGFTGPVREAIEKQGDREE